MTEQRVCHACIGDKVLKAEIRRLGDRTACSYCDGSTRKTMSIDWLSRRVDDVYRQMVCFAEEEPILISEDKVSLIYNGDTPSALVTSLIQPSFDDISVDIVNSIASSRAFDIHKDGDTDWYDDSSDVYKLDMPSDPIYTEAWNYFCNSIKHKNRFFSADAEANLDLILQPVLLGTAPFQDVVISIGRNDNDRFIYRAREANDEESRNKIYSAPITELSAPPVAKATAGRMNPAGISVFYASRDIETAVAELRVPVGGAAIIGKFEIIKRLRLLDLTKLDELKLHISPFQEEYFITHSHVNFLKGFHDQIRMPIIPGKESLDYLPTQVVAEYLATRDNAVDGVIFSSSQVSGDKHNVVLFGRSSRVEGIDDESRQSVNFNHFTDGSKNLIGQETVYRKPIEPKHKSKDKKIPIRRNSISNPFIKLEHNDPKPTLRLLLDELCRVKIKAIHYSVARNAVLIRDDLITADDLNF